MRKGRLEAFSDGVFAIIITIMVLEFKVPQGSDWDALQSLLNVFLSYLLSFVFIGIYWNNHHHMFHAVEKVNGGTLWANLHLLFWISLVPFVTAWMGANHFDGLPVALYGFVLLMSGFGYKILAGTMVIHHGQESRLAKALGRDFKGLASLLIYVVAIPVCFVSTWIAFALYVSVAILWLVPDRRFEGTHHDPVQNP